MHTCSFQLWNDVFIRCVCACVAGLRWVWQKESLLTASAPSQSVGILSRRLSLKRPHSSFSACFLELVPTPCPRTVAVTIVSLPGSNLAHSSTCLQSMTLRRLFFAHNWPVASHDTCPRISTCCCWFWASIQIYVSVLLINPYLSKMSEVLPHIRAWHELPHLVILPSPSSYGSQLLCLPCPSPALSSHTDHLQSQLCLIVILLETHHPFH